MATTPAAPSLRKDAQRNLERLLDAAQEAFASDGIDVGVDEIARRAGVGIGTLYRRFPTKEALIDAIVDRRTEEIVALVDQAVAVSHDDPWGGVALFFSGILERHARDRGFKALIAARTDDTGKAALRARVRPRLVELVQRAQAAGELRADVTVDDLTVLFWGAGRALEITGDVTPEYWRRYAGLVLDGLRAPAATPLDVPALTDDEADRLATAWAASCRMR
ncbi:MAG: TetR/AcrR family transcriptional regulator [Solirubrobacteraceae bacterium]|nr:TetR/AcrR family transcriptional regulator [Solirubrobacteraceae bacterium]